MIFISGSRLVNVCLIKLFYDHPLTQCYLLEFYRNFKLMLTRPKMLETGTKATSTSHQTSTSTETHQEDTDTMLT